MEDVESTAAGPGAGARRQRDRLVAARRRRMKADGATPDELAAAGDHELPHERAWRIGAEGEARLGARLDAGAGWGCYGVLHDLTSPDGGRANIDHLVVGPAGVWVVDCKAWGGAVRVGPRALFLGRHGKRRELAGVGRQVERVRRALSAEGRPDVPVRGLLCLVNDNPGLPPSRLVPVQGIGVGDTQAVVSTVASGTTYDSLGIHAVLEMLERRFTVAGGSVLPPPGSIAPDRLVPPDPGGLGEDRRLRWTAPRRPGRWLARGIARRLQGLLPLAMLGALAFSQLDALEPMSREELGELRPALRAAAERRAGGAVRGPRVVEGPLAFRLVYRRGSRCRVVVSVDRSARAFDPDDHASVAVRSTRCRQGAPT